MFEILFVISDHTFMTSAIDILFIFADGGGRRVKKLVIFVDVINE